MTTDTITALTDRVNDIADTLEGAETIVGVQMGEAADGSGRHYALVQTQDNVNGLEQEFRVMTAAPAGAPGWAAIYRDLVTELRTGDTWLTLEPVTP